MSQVTKDNAAKILFEAQIAAARATRVHLDKYGDRDACGFAWVKIRPARGPLITAAKRLDIGRTSYGGGYDIWNPSGHPTQSISAKEAGADAFASVLQKYGINAYSQSRMD